MNNELQQHKKSDTVKWILTLIAFILVGVMLLGIILGWFEKKNNPTDTEEMFELETSDEGGLTASELESSSGISLMSAVIPRSEYAVNAIDADAEKAITLTATVTPGDSEYQAVDWSAEFVSETWATGKKVSDYVTVSPTGNLTATVTCKQAFGAQVKVTATCRISPQSSAVCTFDYAKKPLTLQRSTMLTSVTGSDNFGSGDLVSSHVTTDSYYNNYKGTFSVKTYSSTYTVDDTFTLKFYRKLTPNAVAKLKGNASYRNLKMENELGYIKEYEVQEFDATLVGAMLLYGADTTLSRSSAPFFATWSDSADFEEWMVKAIGSHGTYTFTSKFGFSKSALQAAVAKVSMSIPSYTF